MVDAARQMLDELMGRNRNLHPSEVPRTISWDDSEFCQYYIVNFCPHDLFVNTRADLGPCYRIHDDEAKRLYEKAKPSHRKKQYEDEFLEFCNSMLSDVDRKIQKGKQRLELMQKDHAASQSHMSKYQEQLNILYGRIKKLLIEAEEAGVRGDVDQAQDLMNLCEQLKIERDFLIQQHENIIKNSVAATSLQKPSNLSSPLLTTSHLASSSSEQTDKPPSQSGGDNLISAEKIINHNMMEKQMEVCEVCGAFLIVGDVQQRIEDHLMGKQHLGFHKLRKAVEEIHERRKKERQQDELRKRDDRSVQRNNCHIRSRDIEHRRESYNRGRSYEQSKISCKHNDRNKDHKTHKRNSHSKSCNYRNSYERYECRSRSRAQN